MTQTTITLPEQAGDELLRIIKDFRHGPVWQWANKKAAPDTTTDAFLAAATALEDLRTCIIQDAANEYRARLDAKEATNA